MEILPYRLVCLADIAAAEPVPGGCNTATEPLFSSPHMLAPFARVRCGSVVLLLAFSRAEKLLSIAGVVVAAADDDGSVCLGECAFLYRRQANSDPACNLRR
jgi:hypothetical protein